MKLKKIKVYGRLRKFLGQSYFEAAVASPKQAFHFLIANFPEVEKHMMNQFYKIKMGGMDITEDLLSLQSDEDIQIIPVAIGAKGVVLGGLLTAGGSAVGATLLGSTLLATTVSTALTVVGTNMLINEASNLLMPPQDISSGVMADSFSQNDPTFQSFGFGSISNVARAGVPVPIIYGEVFTGSVVISSGIDTVQVEGTT
jgi:predicted phage tail protein